MSHGHHRSPFVASSIGEGIRGWHIWVLYSSVFPNCSHLNYLLLLFSSSCFLPLPTSSFSPEGPICLHQLASLRSNIFSFGCRDPGVQDTMQLLNTPFAGSEMRLAPLISYLVFHVLKGPYPCPVVPGSFCGLGAQTWTANLSIAISWIATVWWTSSRLQGLNPKLVWNVIPPLDFLIKVR